MGLLIHLLRGFKLRGKIISFFIFLSISSNIYAFSIPQNKKSISEKCVEYILATKYDSALLFIEKNEEKEVPLYFVLKLTVLSMRDVDFETPIDTLFFMKIYNEAIKKCEKYETVNEKSSYSRMLYGTTKAIYAANLLKQKKYFAAVPVGFNAMDLLNEAYKIDSTNYDAEFFLGLYEFALSELRSKLWWVLFWYPGNRANGIKRVRRCAENGIIIGKAALIPLCEMYIQDKKAEEARKIMEEFKKKYPDSRFVLWSEAKYYESQREYNKSAEIFEKLSESYKREKYGEFNYIFTIFKKAEMNFKNGDKVATSVICKELLKNPSLNKYKDLKKEVEKLYARCK
ncbi:MAG: hypothetical protein N2053_02235 [Chitinispirillaceae bacterium]|nr:hypothetical protein [Chitinispirillaceae bacterium]